jgi:hypothetical protein
MPEISITFEQLRELIHTIDQQRHDIAPNAPVIHINQPDWLAIVSRVGEVNLELEARAELDEIGRNQYVEAIAGERRANEQLGSVNDWLRQVDWWWIHQQRREEQTRNRTVTVDQQQHFWSDLEVNLQNAARAAGLSEIDMGTTVQRTYVARVVFNVPVAIEHGRDERHTDGNLSEDIATRALRAIADGQVEPTPITHISDPSVDETEDIPF